MDADELEDYLELQDSKVQRFIEKGHQEYPAGKSRPAEELLAELKKEGTKTRAWEQEVELNYCGLRTR